MKRLWTSKEIEYLKLNYSNKFTAEIATELDRSVRAVYQAATVYGLKKSPEFMKMALEREAVKLMALGKRQDFRLGIHHIIKDKKCPKNCMSVLRSLCLRKAMSRII